MTEIDLGDYVCIVIVHWDLKYTKCNNQLRSTTGWLVMKSSDDIEAFVPVPLIIELVIF